MINYAVRENGTYQITFETAFFFGDLVEFDSDDSYGVGSIIGITLGSDGAIYYTVDLGDGMAQAGIYAREMTLIERGGGAPGLAAD